ncbi:MAG: hypothetical protein A2Z49_02450 [Chloroflexi bacterium RBG_19FT_COMBO_56_12]|nr:MAG: hypothetical protein A2Z49_02450 [Chloroflexi bacterium RBG_19FT_COMBO_56_12]
MKRESISKIIALLAIPAVLALAEGIVSLLAYLEKYARASFEYTPYFFSWFAAGLVLAAAWFLLGWLVLFEAKGFALVSLAYLVIGLLIVIIPFIPLLGALVGLGWTSGLVIFLHRYLLPEHVNLTGAYMAVLGLLSIFSIARQGNGKQ